MLSLNTLLKPTDEMLDILHRRKKNMNVKTKEWVKKNTATKATECCDTTVPTNWKPFDVVINEKHHTINNIDEAKAFIVDLLEALKFETLIENYKLE